MIRFMVLVARAFLFMAKDPAAVADKWKRRIQAATPDIQAGIQAVTEAPGRAAVRKRNKYVQGVQSSVDKWANNTQRVGLQEWQDKAINVGVPRIAAGAEANEDKVQAFHAEFLPFLDGVTAKVRAMPDDTPQARIQRAVAQMQGTAAFRRRGS